MKKKLSIAALLWILALVLCVAVSAPIGAEGVGDDLANTRVLDGGGNFLHYTGIPAWPESGYVDGLCSVKDSIHPQVPDYDKESADKVENWELVPKSEEDPEVFMLVNTDEWDPSGVSIEEKSGIEIPAGEYSYTLSCEYRGNVYASDIHIRVIPLSSGYEPEAKVYFSTYDPETRIVTGWQDISEEEELVLVQGQWYAFCGSMTGDELNDLDQTDLFGYLIGEWQDNNPDYMKNFGWDEKKGLFHYIHINEVGEYLGGYRTTTGVASNLNHVKPYEITVMPDYVLYTDITSLETIVRKQIGAFFAGKDPGDMEGTDLEDRDLKDLQARVKEELGEESPQFDVVLRLLPLEENDFSEGEWTSIRQAAQVSELSFGEGRRVVAEVCRHPGNDWEKEEVLWRFTGEKGQEKHDVFSDLPDLPSIGAGDYRDFHTVVLTEEDGTATVNDLGFSYEEQFGWYNIENVALGDRFVLGYTDMQGKACESHIYKGKSCIHCGEERSLALKDGSFVHYEGVPAESEGNDVYADPRGIYTEITYYDQEPESVPENWQLIGWEDAPDCFEVNFDESKPDCAFVVTKKNMPVPEGEWTYEIICEYAGERASATLTIQVIQVTEPFEPKIRMATFDPEEGKITGDWQNIEDLDELVLECGQAYVFVGDASSKDASDWIFPQWQTASFRGSWTDKQCSEGEWTDYGTYGWLRFEAPGEFTGSISNTAWHWDVAMRKSYSVRVVGMPPEVNVLQLPPVREIEEEAFCGVMADTVKIPSGCVSIGKNAFAASGVKTAYVPGTVEIIGEGAFPEGTVIVTAQGSEVVESWAQTNGCSVVYEKYED